MSIRAVILDLDGVIVSTDEYHYRAWKALADEIGAAFDRERNNRLRGVSRMRSLEILLESASRAYTPQEKEALAHRKNERYRSLLQNLTPGDLSPGVLEALQALRRQGLKLAIGSSSKNAPLILRRIGLEGFFDAVCDGNRITRSKPDPEVFQRAAELLGMAPAECLVVEDAEAGALAARAAGMKVACVGDAAAKGAGDANLASLGDLPARIMEGVF